MLSAAESFLTPAVQGTRLFDIVELEARDDPGGALDAGTTPAPERSRAQPAAYLLLVSIDEWVLDRNHPGARSRSGGTGHGQMRARVGMSFRILDAPTDQVVFSAVERAEVALPRGQDVGMAEGLRGLDHDALADLAVRACINKGVWRVANWFRHRPWTGSVSGVEKGYVDIDAGSRHGLAPGMTLTVFSHGKQLYDAETGMAAGLVTEAIGEVRIVEIREQSAKAAIVDGCEGIEPGDRVQLGGGSAAGTGYRAPP